MNGYLKIGIDHPELLAPIYIDLEEPCPHHDGFIKPDCRYCRGTGVVLTDNGQVILDLVRKNAR